MTEFYLIIGTGLLIIAIHDFFFTTLSASGAGFLSESVSIVADRVIQFVTKIFGRKAYDYHGLVVNLLVLLVWLLLIWAGLYFVFSSRPEAITNSNDIAANNWERLYFTGYTLSTLGMGNFKPTTAFFELLTSCFSFFGFIFFTSSMTYFLSVSSAVVQKRTLAKSIYNLGSNPDDISEKLLSMNSSYSFQQILSLQEMIDRHSVSHHAYPVIHFYSQSEEKDCLSLNITRLDEAISILIFSGKEEKFSEELALLRSSLTNFLLNLRKNFSRSLPKTKELNLEGLSNEMINKNSEELVKRRRILESLLKSEGFTWKEVFESSDKKNLEFYNR